MAFREVGVVEVREVLRGWLDGAGLRTVGERAGVDRKTARRYVAAAEAAGLSREAGLGALTDELIGAVVAAVRPARPDGHGSAWEGALAWAGRSVSRAVDLHERGGAGDGNRTRVASLEGRAEPLMRPRDLVRRPTPGTGRDPGWPSSIAR